MILVSLETGASSLSRKVWGMVVSSFLNYSLNVCVYVIVRVKNYCLYIKVFLP